MRYTWGVINALHNPGTESSQVQFLEETGTSWARDFKKKPPSSSECYIKHISSSCGLLYSSKIPEDAPLGSIWTCYEDKIHPNTEFVVWIFEIWDIKLLWQLTLECFNNCHVLGFCIYRVWHLMALYFHYIYFLHYIIYFQLKWPQLNTVLLL